MDKEKENKKSAQLKLLLSMFPVKLKSLNFPLNQIKEPVGNGA